MRYYEGLNFLKGKRICMVNVVEGQGLLSSNSFHTGPAKQIFKVGRGGGGGG